METREPVKQLELKPLEPWWWDEPEGSDSEGWYWMAQEYERQLEAKQEGKQYGK